MPDLSRRSRTSALVAIGRTLRLLADFLGAGDARPRTLLAGYGLHLVRLAHTRAADAGIKETDDHLGYVLHGLAPERLGNAIVFLDSETAERSINELAEFLELAKSLASDRIGTAQDAAELTDGLIASLDVVHSFLIANSFVREEYLEATAGDWLDYAPATASPGTSRTTASDPKAYDDIVERTPAERRPTSAAANQHDLAIAA